MPGKPPPAARKGGADKQDVEMRDSDDATTARPKSKKDKDGDDEMTVVMPPSKKKSAAAGAAGDGGDVDMDMIDSSQDDEEVDEDGLALDPVNQGVSDIMENFELLERAVALFDARFTLRALRSISLVRSRLSQDILSQTILEVYHHSSASDDLAGKLLTAIGREKLIIFLNLKTDLDSDSSKASSIKKESLFEIGIYLGILVQVYLLDTKQYRTGSEISAYLILRICNLNRRTLDLLAAKVFFYYALFVEQLEPLPPSPRSPIVAIRPSLLAALRTAVLRKDVDTQASVIVLLLRNYLQTAHIAQADLLISHTIFPETAANNQVARFLYYLGRIRAIQLRYTEAHEHLTAATRKAPSSVCAVGFAQTATKHLLVVELLMGDIPDRATFRQPTLELTLQPYFALVQAVRVGNLETFENLVGHHAGTFRRDGTYTLILRLRQNVIKTGIRMMSLSYSRISLRDICIRLHLGSEESAEYVVAKAIRDGFIEATLDREHGFMKSKEVGDVYATREPGEAFHERIVACLALHDESVKAMRFPMNQHRLELKNAQQAQEREREMVQEIQGGDLDDDDLGGDYDGL